MAWASCGTDSVGRPIGYAYRATCDEPGCRRRIDRGLAYACGGMHGADEWSCEGYFCADHLEVPNVSYDRGSSGPLGGLCRRCRRRYEIRHQRRNARGCFMSAT